MKRHLAVLLVTVVVLTLLLSACGAVSDLKTVNETGKAFMTALGKGDSTGTWAMLAPNVQEEIGDEAAWADWISIRQFPKWSFSNTEVNNNTAQMDGTAELDGQTYNVALIFDKVDESWLISGIQFFE